MLKRLVVSLLFSVIAVVFSSNIVLAEQDMVSILFEANTAVYVAEGGTSLDIILDVDGPAGTSFTAAVVVDGSWWSGDQIVSDYVQSVSSDVSGCASVPCTFNVSGTIVDGAEFTATTTANTVSGENLQVSVASVTANSISYDRVATVKAISVEDAVKISVPASVDWWVFETAKIPVTVTGVEFVESYQFDVIVKDQNLRFLKITSAKVISTERIINYEIIGEGTYRVTMSATEPVNDENLLVLLDFSPYQIGAMDYQIANVFVNDEPAFVEAGEGTITGTNWQVSGNVTHKGTGTPLSNVTLTSKSETDGTQLSVVTDSEGSWNFESGRAKRSFELSMENPPQEDIPLIVTSLDAREVMLSCLRYLPDTSGCTTEMDANKNGIYDPDDLSTVLHCASGDTGYNCAEPIFFPVSTWEELIWGIENFFYSSEVEYLGNATGNLTVPAIVTTSSVSQDVTHYHIDSVDNITVHTTDEPVFNATINSVSQEIYSLRLDVNFGDLAVEEQDISVPGAYATWVQLYDGGRNAIIYAFYENPVQMTDVQIVLHPLVPSSNVITLEYVMINEDVEDILQIQSVITILSPEVTPDPVVTPDQFGVFLPMLSSQ